MISNTNLYGTGNAKLLEQLTSTEPVNAVNDKCSRCGNCCTHHLNIFPYEIKRIKQYIKDHNIKPCTKFEQPQNCKKSGVIDLTCPFLDQSKPENKCTIYEVRPWICRSYLCSKRDNIDHMERALKDELEKSNVTIEEIMQQKEHNVQQLFFPNEYTPKQGEPVVVNGLHTKAMLQYKDQIFIYTGQTRKTNDNITEAFLINQYSVFWFDIAGLATIHNII